MRRVLFVCTENAARSQMAEAFMRHHAGGRIEPASAGSKPSGRIDPRAAAVMAERGIDLAGQRSKGLREIPPGAYAAVVMMGCGDACPWVAADTREEWGLPAPGDLDEAGLRGLRDEIERRVLDLIARLDR